jgi:hypothetical protein
MPADADLDATLSGRTQSLDSPAVNGTGGQATIAVSELGLALKMCPKPELSDVLANEILLATPNILV